MLQSLNACKTDDDVLDLLTKELERRVPREDIESEEGLVAAIRSLPQGLRAMAATYDLDVSMAMDDLGWHFANHHSLALAQETSDGLHELGAVEERELFERARSKVDPHWDTITSLLSIDFENFADWYSGSDLQKAMEPLNTALWEALSRQPHALMSYWVVYARKHPERLRSA